MRAEGDYHGACDEYHGLLASKVPGTQFQPNLPCHIQ